MRALPTRSGGGQPEWELALDGWTLRTPDGASIDLSAPERSVLLRLVNTGAGGHPVSHDSLIGSLTNDVYDFDPHRLEMLIYRLRKKVALMSPLPLPLRAVRGMLGAARIWYSLSRDGLLPGWFAKIHPKYGTPHRPTIALGVFTALVAGFLPIGEVAKLVNIGVLSAFIIICASVWVLRVRKPNLERSFRTPLVPFIPIVGIAFSIWLLAELAAITWLIFLIWVSLGLLVYFAYGIRHSKLAQETQE